MNRKFKETAFYNIINVFTVTFNSFNASLLKILLISFQSKYSTILPSVDGHT